MADYSKAVIYTIRSKDSIYVGSTINFISRKNQHKACIYDEKRCQYNRKLYKTIRENGEWSMRPYRVFPCNSKMELNIEEERVRRELNADLNMNSCWTGLTEKEYRIKYCEENKEKISEIGRQYREENKEKLRESKKQYYQENKEQISEQLKQYREKNKEQISEQQKRYREENKEKLSEYLINYYQENKKQISEQRKQYREENKEKISEQKKEKMTCECGSICRKYDLARHKKTKKHLDWEKLK